MLSLPSVVGRRLSIYYTNGPLDEMSFLGHSVRVLLQVLSTEEMSAMLGADEMAEYFDLMDQAKKAEKEKKEEDK